MVNLAIRLESAGLVTDSTPARPVHHGLLMPRRPHLLHGVVGDEGKCYGPYGEAICAELEGCRIAWEGVEAVPVDSSQSRAAFWAVYESRTASATQILDVVKRWGALDCNWTGDSHGDDFIGDGRGFLPIAEWRNFGATLEKLLTLLISTANNELIPLDLLKEIRTWEPLPEVLPTTLPSGTELVPSSDEEVSIRRQAWYDALADRFDSSDDYYEAGLRLQWENLTAERARGEGIQQQRRLLTSHLQSIAGMREVLFLWDAKGRRIETAAVGLDAIAISFVVGLFGSADPEVFTCSVCGSHFPFDETRPRRPRHGARVFCSNECRAEGKRLSNRESWRRNSHRWGRRKAQ